jgi:rsbT co-antagonist protein RsbR
MIKRSSTNNFDHRLRNILDKFRSANIALQETRARRLLLDITGVSVVDTQVARGLVNVVHAARLLGTQVTLVGIRPEVAQAIVGLGCYPDL